MAFQQHNPPHPGELIQRTYIDPFVEISANKVADRLGVARSTFNRLLNGNAGLSPEMAVRLSEVLGGSAESWLTLQQSYDLWKARQSVDVKSLQPIDFGKVSEMYGQVRAALKKQAIGPNDTWIAAHALALQLPLVTNNTREFSRVPDLVIDTWMDRK